ncbi:MAG TPA: S53 family peptidase [Streptosporangiaceae bacterium]
MTGIRFWEAHVITMTPRRIAGTVAALALALGGAAAAGPGADAAASGPVARAVCGTPAPGHARCFALIRTDAGARAAAARADAASKTPPGWGATDLESAYSLPISDGSGQTVAIVDAFSDPTAAADLATYRAQYGLPACTTASGCLKIVNEQGKKGSPPPPDGGWSVEMSLDLDMVSTACPKCHILLVEGTSNAVTDLATSVTTAARLGAGVISNSYGLDEFGGMKAYYADYHPAGAAVVASSGDLGFTAAQFPAVAPGVTVAGGTSLYKSDNSRGYTEHAWSGSSSGCSAYVRKPAFQKTVSPHCTMRTTADVSSVADPTPGVAIYDTTPNPYGLTPGWLVIGGTSAASPLIAGVIGLAGNGSTFRTGQIYVHPQYLHDVTAGSNGYCGGDYLCTAKKGYDGPTGMGTPNGIGAF